MKAELVNVPNRGICILISELDLNMLLKYSGHSSNSTHPLIYNPAAVANEIRIGQKIAAIKELRSQTGWGLKESKEYIDKYMFPGNYNRDTAAERFMSDHMPSNFLDIEEMTI